MKNRKVIAIWLLIGCGIIASMMSIGAATRLTGSGLSIVKWDLVVGVVPPLNNQEWMKSFNEYKQSPQYKDVNKGMSLSSYKSIFWWEYFHRLLGRFIGLFFIGQLFYFYFKNMIKNPMVKKYIYILIGLGIVGSWGWFMVKSGLINVPRVSPYRLAIHLLLAFSLYTYVFWTAIDLILPFKKDNIRERYQNKFRTYSLIILGLLGVQILFGGLMSGLRASLYYPSFPLMNGHFIPDNMLVLSPFWVNFFENQNLVNFIHRTLPYIIGILIILFWWRGRSVFTSKRLIIANNLLVLALLLQITLGAFTVIHSLGNIPVGLGVAHQGGAVILLTVMLFMSNQLHDTKEIKDLVREVNINNIPV
jgi:cytochrome c oxidase assembly protein subunit 15